MATYCFFGRIHFKRTQIFWYSGLQTDDIWSATVKWLNLLDARTSLFELALKKAGDIFLTKNHLHYLLDFSHFFENVPPAPTFLPIKQKAGVIERKEMTLLCFITKCGLVMKVERSNQTETLKQASRQDKHGSEKPHIVSKLPRPQRSKH